MCKHFRKRGTHTTHTCCGFYTDLLMVYCVPCLHDMYSLRQVEEISITQFPKRKDITWNGELSDPDAREMHERRIRNCDVSYPLLVTEPDKDGNVEVIDGCHRLCWLHDNHYEMVKVIILSESDLGACKFYDALV